MSRRNELRVPKYAFIKFACDGKTLQAKTTDLVSDGVMSVNCEVRARWENEMLKATILGLSDDPTVLMEKERQYMKKMKPPSQKATKVQKSNLRPLNKAVRPDITRQTATLKGRTRAPKRKETPDIVFIPSKIRKPTTSTHSTVPVSAFSFERLSSEQSQKIQKLVENARSTGCSNNSPPLPVSPSLPDPTPPTCPPLVPASTSVLDLPDLTPPSHSLSAPASPSLPDLTSLSCSPPVPASHSTSSTDYSSLSRLVSSSHCIASGSPYVSDMPAPTYNPSLFDCLTPTPFLHSVFPTHPPSSDIPSFLNMDTNDITVDNNPSSPCIPCLTPPPAEDRGTIPSFDLHGLYGKLDDVLNYMQRLEAKVDAILPRDRSEPVRVSMGTQTDATDIVDGDCSQNVRETPVDVSQTPLPPAFIPTVPSFIDPRIWDLRPSDLEGEQVTPERLTEAIGNLPAHSPVTDDLNISEAEMKGVLVKSHGSSHLAKNLMFKCFTLGELYGRNTNGKNYGGPKKTALNKAKIQKITSIIGLHYKEENIDKKTVTAVNAGLRYLWNIRFKHAWLPLDTIPIRPHSIS